MTRRNHQVLLQKKGNKYQHVLITGGSVINLGSTQHSGHSDRSDLPTDKNVETVAYQAMIEPPIEKAPKTTEDVLSEINKRFSAFTSGDRSGMTKNKRFRL